MPIEIKELIIKAEVSNDIKDIKTKTTNNEMKWTDKNVLIEECVDRVLAILEKIKER